MIVYIVMHWYYEEMKILGVYQNELDAERKATEFKQMWGNSGWVEISQQMVQ